jgi:hypothetical protein
MLGLRSPLREPDQVVFRKRQFAFQHLVGQTVHELVRAMLSIKQFELDDVRPNHRDSTGIVPLKDRRRDGSGSDAARLKRVDFFDPRIEIAEVVIQDGIVSFRMRHGLLLVIGLPGRSKQPQNFRIDRAELPHDFRPERMS